MTTPSLRAPRYVGPWRAARATACFAALVAGHGVLAAVNAAHAQVIAVKTAPVSDGGQFAFLPSANAGMGGLSIAVDDSSLDPFVNPAKGSRLKGANMFVSPTFFSVSRQAGGGLTLPLGMSASGKTWFGQFAVAMQEIDELGPDDAPLIAATLGTSSTFPISGERDRSRQNRYAHGVIGRRFANQLSVAASASWWRINAMDGVELYYPNGSLVKQRGEAADIRIGALKSLSGGRTMEVIALHNRLGVNQDVAFTEFFWDPSERGMKMIPRLEPNADRTHLWGLHLAYTQPLADSTWRVGAILTGNRVNQSSLPDYNLPLVPGDAGHANAFNIGAGITRSTGIWTVGLDAIFEPIWNNTWVRADDEALTSEGTTLTASARTLENDFRFTNALTRLGVAARLPFSSDYSLTLETGGQLHAIRYRLEQQGNLRDTQTASTQRWNEWTRSWGLTLRSVHADLRYSGRMTTGARRPGFDNGGGLVFDSVRPLTSSFLPPVFTLPFDKVRATTHQISLSVPIR